MRRPTTDGERGSYVTTPRAATMMRLLGGAAVTSGVAVTRDEKAAIDRLYGYVPEKPRRRPERPVEPVREDFPDWAAHDKAHRAYKAALTTWEKWEDPRSFMQAGADRDAFRHAEADGLRMLAWIAGYLEPGDDPVKVLVQMAMAARWGNVDPADVDWAEQDGCETEEEAA